MVVPVVLGWGGAVLLVAAVVVSLAAAPAAADDEAARYNPGACQKSSFRCGDTVDVRYPFFLANATNVVVEGDTAYSRAYCGYPGMAIACEDGRATLKLKGDNYTVLDIDYVNHTATVADADVLTAGGGDDDDCPRVTHNVTVPTETWLNLSTTANDNLVFFYDCVFTAETPPPPPAILPAINCSSFRDPTSGAMSFVVVQPDTRLQDEFARACKEPAVVVPVLKDRLFDPDEDYLPRLNSDGYGKVLKQGFQLTWDPSAGSCYFCEKSSGQCSYDQIGEFIGCLCSDGRVRSPDCKPQPDDDAYFRYSNCTPTPYRCGSLQFDVAYPLSVTGAADRPDYCSFPGYRLVCTNGSKLLITMNAHAPAGAWTFQVTSIDYENRLLTLVDQGLAQQTCLQSYRNTTINSTLFAYTDRDQFLTVYVNCTGGGDPPPLPLVVDVLSCLSGGRSYYSQDNGTVAPDVLGTCSSTLVVPYNSSMAAAAGGSGLALGDAIKGGFAARWTAGAGWCRDCENSGGHCGYNSSSPTDHTCYCPDGTVIGTCSSGIFCPPKSSFASQDFLFLP